MKNISYTFRFLIICLFIIRTLGRHVININVEGAKKVTDDNHIQVELKEDSKLSRENFISECSSSYSSERCTENKVESKLKPIVKTRKDCESNSNKNTESNQSWTKTNKRINRKRVQKPQRNSNKSKTYARKIIAKSKKHNFRKKMCDKVNNIEPQNSSRNSTIEASDYNYQANITFKENNDVNKDMKIADYTYTVSIQRKGAHYASGALVGERWVLTTAAEFYNVRETIKLFRIRLGSTDCKKGGVVLPVKRIVIHPDFTPGKPGFDVSIVTLAQAVPVSAGVKAIRISKVAGKVVGGNFLTTYWPRIVVSQGVVPPTAKERIKYSNMRASTQSLVPTEDCEKQFSTMNLTVEKGSLCLKPVELLHSVCMPDVGAPVVAVDGLWGITSGWVSPECPESPLPTVFTRVSMLGLRNWIDNQTQQLHQTNSSEGKLTGCNQSSVPKSHPIGSRKNHKMKIAERP